MRNIFGLIIILIIFTGCQKKEATSATNSQDLSISSRSWVYSTNMDEMTGKKAMYASLTSNNIEHFKFPYDGGSTLELNVRSHPRMGTDVYISISKGQFNKHYDNNSILVKFDANNPQKYSVLEPSDNSSNMFFIQSSKKFINQIKKSKKIIIEVEFYSDGIRRFEFNSEGFQWK